METMNQCQQIRILQFCIVVNVLIRVYASSPLFVCLVVVMLLFLYSHMQGNR